VNKEAIGSLTGDPEFTYDVLVKSVALTPCIAITDGLVYLLQRLWP